MGQELGAGVSGHSALAFPMTISHPLDHEVFEVLSFHLTSNGPFRQKLLVISLVRTLRSYREVASFPSSTVQNLL